MKSSNKATFIRQSDVFNLVLQKVLQDAKILEIKKLKWNVFDKFLINIDEKRGMKNSIDKFSKFSFLFCFSSFKSSSVVS
jgi:hypothetical protein